MIVQDIQVLNAKIEEAVARLQKLEAEIDEQEQELKQLEQDLADAIQRIMTGTSYCVRDFIFYVYERGRLLSGCVAASNELY